VSEFIIIEFTQLPLNERSEEKSSENKRGLTEPGIENKESEIPQNTRRKISTIL
jgi:hypothetical protein